MRSGRGVRQHSEVLFDNRRESLVGSGTRDKAFLFLGIKASCRGILYNVGRVSPIDEER